MFSQRYALLTFLFVIPYLLPNPVIAQTEPPPVQKPLKVGIAGSPPFTIYTESRLKGISVEIWQELAREAKLDYQMIPQPGVKVGLNRVATGELDILIGPVSITADRFQKVAFTQPYFKTNIGLLVSGEVSVWSRVRPLFQVAVISSVGGLFVILFLVGNLIWLAEFRRNETQFPKQYVRGVGNGMWFALVTLTTVGYGDKAPITKTGKVITSVWMLITMVAASSLTAGIATTLTLLLSEKTTENFTQPEDIKGKQIAVVTGTTGAQWADTYQARLLESSTLEKAIQRLKSGQAEGVMFDIPALEYYLYQHPNAPFRLANISFAAEDYGFVLPLDSELVYDLNFALIQLKESGRLEEIIQQEIQGEEEPKSTLSRFNN